MTRTLATLFACFTLMAALGPAAAHAASVPVSIDIPNLRCVQTRTPGEGKTDNIYLLVNGVVKGKATSVTVPKRGVMKASPKVMPIQEKKNAQTLWKGDLADGEFAMFTVTLMQVNPQGKGPIKPFTDALSAALNASAARSKKTLNAAEFKALAKDTGKSLAKLVVGVKKLAGREVKTDFYGGMFSVLKTKD